MAIGRISGPMLYNNLERQGIDLAIDGNLVYADVSNRRVGIGTSSPQYSLDVPGNVRLANLVISGNTITSNLGPINFGPLSNLTITGGSANNVIITNGLGTVSFADLNSLPALLMVNANIVAANAAIVTANTGMRNYVDSVINAETANVAAANAAIVTANNAVVSYVNTLNSAQTANLTAANAAITALQQTQSATYGNTIQLGANSAGYLISNAVALTTATSVTNAISQLNLVLGKLVPPAPPTFPGASSLSLTSATTSALMCNFVQTDNSGWGNLSVSGGTAISAVRSSTYTAGTITSVGPGDSGTVTAYRNGVAAGSTTMNGSSNGTYSNLVIASNQDYHNVVSSVTAGFWYSFNASLSGSGVPAGWNRANIVDSAGGSTNTITWYYDSAAPGAPTFSNTSITLTSNSVTYSSTIPHLNSSSQFTLKGNVAKLSGDMYPNSTNLFSSTAAGGAMAAPATVTYSGAGVTTPLAQNLYVSSGSAYFQSTSAVISGFGSSSSGPSVTVNNSYNSASNTFSPGVTVLYKTGTGTQIEETNLTVAGSVGSGAGQGIRIQNPGSTDTPVYTGSESNFNSQTGTLTTSDATVVGAVLKFDQTNYSTGYLPVGPNLSGQASSQYFTFKFIRSSVSKFDIAYTGTIAGLWVALPGSQIDSTSTLNGWLSMSTAYAGSGIPGATSPGNGSNGCALGGLATLNSSGTYSVTATFGTVSSSSTATNEIYVRVKLTSGQTVSALSIQVATH